MNNEEKILSMLEKMESRQSKTETMLEKMESRQSKTETMLETLTADMSEVKSDVAVLKTDVAVLKTDVADLKEGQRQTNAKLEQVINRQDNAEAVLDTLVVTTGGILTDVSVLKTDVAVLKEGQAALEQGQAALEQGQRQTNAKLDKVIDTQDKAEAMLDTLVVTTGGILTDVSEIKSKVNELEIDVAIVKLVADKNELRVRRLETNRKTS